MTDPKDPPPTTESLRTEVAALEADEADQREMLEVASLMAQVRYPAAR